MSHYAMLKTLGRSTPNDMLCMYVHFPLLARILVQISSNLLSITKLPLYIEYDPNHDDSRIGDHRE